MDKIKFGKTIFAILVAALIVSVSWLSYFYLGGGQEAFTGTDDEAGVIPTDDEDSMPIITDLAPDFTYTAVNGGTVSLSSLRGNVVVLDFMATWCAPCESQIINIKQIYNEYASKGVVFISIDVDTGETASQLLAFRNELGAAWDFVLDEDGIGMDPKYNAASIPTMLFIDKEGKIANRDVGVMSGDALRDVIDPLL